PKVRNMVSDMRAEAVRSFGAGVPEWAGDLGLEERNGVNWLAVADAPHEPAVPARPRRKSDAPRTTDRPSGSVKALMPAEALHIRGMHNAMNGLAALALGRCIGLD